MGFVSGLPLTPTKKDSIWVIVDRLTKSAHFLPIFIHFGDSEVAWGAHNNYFISRFPFHILILEKDSTVVRKQLGFYHCFPSAVIQILEDELRGCIIEFQGSWEEHLPLVEFSYNNSFQLSIKMAHYKVIYERKC
ncbi:DNA/RNA polymerase superfamily protein [Gossypium australe]|uniref:DNA/RNA polymerase superfamily protein n=1 Tax=Gossypium australe TaxID=47621 RepID=A0A5B6X503_9ROSI|nr:DNA/RNA polymerase superfamily protein [Gossypium australe]